MHDCHCLVLFLSRLEYIEGLPREVSSIANIINLKDEDKICKWDKNILEISKRRNERESNFPRRI